MGFKERGRVVAAPPRSLQLHFQKFPTDRTLDGAATFGASPERA